MLMCHNRFQEETEQPQVQAEWTLVDGQLVCQWQPLSAYYRRHGSSPFHAQATKSGLTPVGFEL